MLDEQLHRLASPRIRGPLLGTLICALAWVAALWGVEASGLARGGTAEIAAAAGLTLAPLLGIAYLFVRLHRLTDEVERAMHLAAAATGFGIMLLVAMLAMHLAALDLGPGLHARWIWAAGMLGWLAGLGRARMRHR